MPGTGWPEPGGLLPREALKLLGLVAREGMCGLEVVEVSPPYDTSDITALFGARVVVEALGAMVATASRGATSTSSTGRSAGDARRPRPGHQHGPGHNHPPRRAVQWQTPHRAAGAAAPSPEQPEPDFDLVEAAFAEGFATASDPTSFLRLAGVPFEGADRAGRRLSLLRVELEQVADIGAVTPHLGGGSFDDPLPAKLVARRRLLRLVYHDGSGLQALTLGQAKALAAAE